MNRLSISSSSAIIGISLNVVLRGFNGVDIWDGV